MHITRREFELAIEKDIYKATNSKVYCTYTGDFLQVWFKELTSKERQKVSDYLKNGLLLTEANKKTELNNLTKLYLSCLKDSKALKIHLFKLSEEKKNSLIALFKVKGC